MLPSSRLLLPTVPTDQGFPVEMLHMFVIIPTVTSAFEFAAAFTMRYALTTVAEAVRSAWTTITV
jgi:hypothetical protein